MTILHRLLWSWSTTNMMARKQPELMAVTSQTVINFLGNGKHKRGAILLVEDSEQQLTVALRQWDMIP